MSTGTWTDHFVVVPDLNLICMRSVDHVGKRYGRLVLVEKMVNPHRYRCRCDCGNEHVVLYTNLSTGNSTSCGCFRKEAASIREHKKNHPTHGRILAYYKRNAKVRGLEWSLTAEQFDQLITGDCRYCGQEPTEHLLVGKKLVFNGIDRVDNAGGYVVENCVPCCATCNRAKLAMSFNEFRAWIARVNGVLNGDVLHE